MKYSDLDQAPIPVYLVDSNDLFREGLKQLLTESPFDVVGESRDMKRLADAPAALDGGPIILIDYPGANAEALADLRTLRSAQQNAKLVVITSGEDQQQFADCVSAGVDGYLLKQISAEILVESLRLVALGEKVFPSVLATWILQLMNHSRPKLPTADLKADLSRRELQILKCLADGDSNKLIARDLGISDATVKVHVKNILRKISATNRTQAAIWALNSGIAGDARFAIGHQPDEAGRERQADRVELIEA